jgi:chromosome segregation ATPase
MVVVLGFALVAGMGPAGTLPARAQCLPQDHCEQLRAQIQGLKEEARALRNRLREAKRDLRSLPEDSPERERLREQVRQRRRELRQFRRDEIRPLRREYRAGCKNC